MLRPQFRMNTQNAQVIDLRCKVLAAAGASADVAAELLRYNANHFTLSEVTAPIPDEAFVAVWTQYRNEVRDAGSIEVLAQYLPQFRFPVQLGMSAQPAYIAAVRRGSVSESEPPTCSLQLRAPERCRIVIHRTPAGHLPAIIAEHRDDFVSLVQALAGRNEPDPIPPSMGALIVSGYNNWHRIALHKREFLSANPDPAGWIQRFDEIRGQPDLYKDRFLLLSTGPYSNVPASELGLDDEDWQRLSLTIRLEHEGAHYFTRRVFGSMQNNLLDELIADCCGIRAAFGRIRANVLLRFFGLESYPAYRDSGRLDNYRGNPRLSEDAFRVLRYLTWSAASNLEAFEEAVDLSRGVRGNLELLSTLSNLTVEEIAAPEAIALLRARHREVVVQMSLASTT
jgi:hypothetical protein